MAVTLLKSYGPDCKYGCLVRLEDGREIDVRRLDSVTKPEGADWVLIWKNESGSAWYRWHPPTVTG